MEKTVCVIGAGISGISAIKSCLEEGLLPTCFESRGGIGGMWNYNKAEKLDRAPVYESLVTNVSKEASCFSDFPYPQDYTPFFSHAKLLEYLASYVEQFDLERHIVFNTEIENVEMQTEDEGQETGKGRWRVKTRNVHTGSRETLGFDCIIVCSGLNSRPNFPSLEGLTNGTFKGKVMHSCQYDCPEEFKGKKVVVIGLGNSGADISVDVSRQASETILSSRSGAWIVPRVFKEGLPADMNLTTRISSFFRAAVPEIVGSWFGSRLLNSGFNHDTLGLRSRYGPMNPSATFLINDELPAKIVSGKIQVKPRVERFGAGEIIFTDGTKEEVDVVICASGYLSSFPFIHDDILPDDRSGLRLFEWMIPYEIPHHNSIALVGVVPSTGGSAIPTVECQTRYIAQIMSGKQELPSVEEMRKSSETHRRVLIGPGGAFIFRGKLGFTYQDRVAKLGGFYPNFWQLFFRDPALAIKVYVGPFMSYHYRLIGRHTWSGARERIFNAIPNTLSAIKSLHYLKND